MVDRVELRTTGLIEQLLGFCVVIAREPLLGGQTHAP